MLCNECEKNTATVHVTKIINGVKTETHLCEECAKKQQAFFNNNFSMENLLAGMLNEAFTESYKDAMPCKTCGMTFDEFKKIGKFGCSDCISMFRDRLMPTIKNLQGYDSHIGKIPKKAGQKYRNQNDIEKLKVDLRSMIDQERYEDAAVIRDKIKDLETRIIEE
ncbi:UvrB/UvrC motif-containing protein [Sedimentibacter sp. zth1]|uniref:UvrB/UvrC motif-containing protein n=1 Tax=Sedimentibacter sp. zth1 TaxID=2816908 RepID=UPI001A92AC71|nr:UvrB/UvrC motif-containing protein [Sedimentibacter sp. zth1]QSX07209.1 UvrB/UvrC motif-containing protein [Sedimentibacter sp. zth1]